MSISLGMSIFVLTPEILQGYILYMGTGAVERNLFGGGAKFYIVNCNPMS